MAGNDRTPAADLMIDEELGREPYAFDFFHALRRLECAHAEQPRLGASPRPVDDPFRLTQEPSLAFAPAAIAGYERGGDGGRPRLSVAFFGLFGPNGPLPLHLTEYARQRWRNHGDQTFMRFADIFHHRMLSLFYRAWASAQPTVQLDRPEADRFALYVGALIGLGQPALRRRDAWPDEAKFHFAGRLGCQARNADGLRAIVSSYFNVPAEIVPFAGEWIDLPAETYVRLGRGPGSRRLGIDTTVGSRTWECRHKFRIRLGPLEFGRYVGFLSDSPRLPRLAALVRNYVGDELAWELSLVLRRDEVPPTVLGRSGRLGLTSWIGDRRQSGNDAEDLVLQVSALALAWRVQETKGGQAA